MLSFTQSALRELPLLNSQFRLECFSSSCRPSASKLQGSIFEPGPNASFLCQSQEIIVVNWGRMQMAARAGATGVRATCAWNLFVPFCSNPATPHFHWMMSFCIHAQPYGLMDHTVSYLRRLGTLRKKLPSNLATSIYYVTWFLRAWTLKTA
jgi:hypothetical protein